MTEDVPQLSGVYLLHPCVEAVDPGAGVEGTHFLQNFIDYYQMMFFTLFTLLAATAIVIIGESFRFGFLFLFSLNLLTPPHTH